MESPQIVPIFIGTSEDLKRKARPLGNAHINKMLHCHYEESNDVVIFSKETDCHSKLKNLLRNDVKIEEASISFSLVTQQLHTTTQRPLFN